MSLRTGNVQTSVLRSKFVSNSWGDAHLAKLGVLGNDDRREPFPEHGSWLNLAESEPTEYGVKEYQYSVVNGHTVLVDPRTRRIVQIID